MTYLAPNHPAVKAGCQAAGEWTEGASVDAQDHITLALHMTAACIIAALPHLTADDLRATQAGQALMAEALEDEACRMDVVISNGDAAEQAAPAPGETGRGGAVTARDALYENPAQYLRERADAYRTETTHE